MDTVESIRLPAALPAIADATRQLRFLYASDLEFGPLLRMLAASKPGGHLLEIGTGTGVGTAWLLDGMDATARLTSVERNADVQAVARKHLGDDRRVTFVPGDAREFLQAQAADSFDLVFADGGPGKITDTELALRLVKPGGVYIGDDLRQHLLQDDGRAARVKAFEAKMLGLTDFAVVKLDWASGVVLATRRA
ncbi:MAG: class I SAM-dependent methyltransferase [Candidatus Rokubacteria bacterium]|nr:class I SAM-dependent methyltransferase [Candidatus Rokubacteria bacterium]